MESEQNSPMHYGAKGKLFQYAKEMRKNPTDSERALWKIINNVPFSEYKFRRQHPLARFIADFYSHKLKLVIEVDGGYHSAMEQMEIDELRDEDMSEFDIAVMRFTDKEVLDHSSDTSNKILERITLMTSQKQ